MPTQIEKARAFRALHECSGTFVIPNPWDPGSARLLASVGPEALTSIGTGLAFSRGLPDYGVGRDTILVHVAGLAAATDVPMAADLENGFGDAPETVAEIIRPVGVIGIVGGSIEDATGRADVPIYSLEASVGCVRTAVEAARALPFPFTFAAHFENYPYGCNDLADMICRLQAFQDAGTNMLYAPGLKTRDEIVVMLREVGRPLNVPMGFADDNLNVAELTELGIKRISVGAMLACVAMSASMRAAEKLRIAGASSLTRDTAGGAKLNGLFAPFV